MKIAMYPGSFDPITYGHLDIILRASQLFDVLDIVIMDNPDKAGTFTIEERVHMLETVTKDIKNIKIIVGEGLTVHMAKKLGAKVLIRGIRAVTDYEYELQLATANMMIDPDIETVFFLTRPENSFLSSSISKLLAKHGENIDNLIPYEIHELVYNKLKKD